MIGKESFSIVPRQDTEDLSALGDSNGMERGDPLERLILSHPKGPLCLDLQKETFDPFGSQTKEETILSSPLQALYLPDVFLVHLSTYSYLSTVREWQPYSPQPY